MKNAYNCNYDPVTVNLAFSLVATPFYGQIVQTRELMEFLESRAEKPLHTVDDYLQEYDDGGYFSYKDFNALLQSERELNSLGLTLDEIKEAIGKTIWCLPCGYFIQQ